jgi:hypothetical protein
MLGNMLNFFVYCLNSRYMLSFLPGGDRLHSKKSRISCFVLILCLISSLVWFDDLKSDTFSCLSDAPAQTTGFASAGTCSASEDICTLEMLGNTQPYLLSQRTAARNVRLPKGVTSVTAQAGLTALAGLSKFFSHAAPADSSHTEAAGIIHFIHNQDGKKRI